MRRGSTAMSGQGAAMPADTSTRRRSSAAIAVPDVASSRRRSSAAIAVPANASTTPFAAAAAAAANTDAPEVPEQEEESVHPPVECVSVDDMMKRQQKSMRPFRSALEVADDDERKLETLDDLAKLAGATNRRQSTVLVAMIQQQLHAAQEVETSSRASASTKATTDQNRRKSLADHRMPAKVEDMDEEQLKTSFIRRRSTLGKDKDATTLKIAVKLADLALSAEEYAEAEKYVRVRMDVSKMDLGSKHPDTLAVTRQLADLQLKQNKYRAANMTLKGTLISHMYMYGDDHQLTLDVKMASANCLFRNKKIDDAARIYRSVLTSVQRIEEADEHKKGYGIEYKYNVYAAYAECLNAQEMYKEAETTYVTLIDLSTQVSRNATSHRDGTSMLTHARTYTRLFRPSARR